MKYTIEQLNKIMKKNNGNLNLSHTDVTQLPDNLTIHGNLDLSYTKITELPNNLTVNGNLSLFCSPITKLPDNLTVNGNLSLFCSPITKLPDNLTVNGNLYLSHAKISQLPNNLTVNGNLDLSSTLITQLPNNLTVKNYLNLANAPITKLPNNLTVGRYLTIKNTNITEIPSSLKVGRDLLSDTLLLPPENRLKNGTYVENNYLYADNILTHIKKTKKINNYTYYIGKIKGENVLYDGVNYSHCSSFKQGVLDLQYKTIKDRGSEQYKNISLTEQIPFDKAVTMYRVITGACKQGTSNFISSIEKKDKKESYSPLEIAKITEYQYGNEVFKKFFDI